MEHVLAFFLTGAALGLASGLSPGPLLLVIFAQTLAHGPREGAKAAMAPLLTDLPVLCLCLFALSRLADRGDILGMVSLAGGLVVLYLGWGCLRARPVSLKDAPGPAGSWLKGAAANAFNPFMYLFWATVGAPAVLQAFQQSTAAAAGFLAGFYLCLLGSMASLAWLSGRFTRFLSGRAYVWTMRVLGGLLWLAALRFIQEGLTRMGLAPFTGAG